MSTTAIQVDSVTKRYGGRAVLDAIKLDVQEGETLVILGGSGSGKSTLLRLMIGNIRYDGGDIRAQIPDATGAMTYKSLNAFTPRELDDYRKSIGVLFQSGA